MKDLYMVYWKSGTRKALVKGENEEEAIKEAKRFCGEYQKIYKVKHIDLDSECYD